MQDSELIGKTNDQNDRLLADLALTRRQSRSLYRNSVALSRKAAGYSIQSQLNVMTKISTNSIANDGDLITNSSCSLIEDRADEIVRHMEQSQTLMDDNPKSNNERIETLRGMTEYLSLKRCVKRKLTRSIGPKCKGISFSKRVKYRISIFLGKIPVEMKNFLSNFELWYSSLKVIEGHFGSSVASYFKFLRKLFLLNACILILILFFIMIPQLLHRFIQFTDREDISKENGLNNETISETGFSKNEKPKSSVIFTMKSDPYKGNGEFRLGNIFTGEGFLTNTILFYGYYSNTSLKIIDGYNFNIPASYFFTSAVTYFIIFFFLFISVVVSYRKCYIEASGGMNNTFSNKIFCGWDFGIATRQAAELKSKSIYIEVKELLDEVTKPKRTKSCCHTFYTTAISVSLNGILLFLLGVGGMYSWKYLDQQMAKADTPTTMMMWLILTIVIALAPVLFSFITQIEGFESRSSALYMTLIRTFTLYAVVVAVVVAYRLNRSSESECWETILGQDIYRLVLLDFIFGLIGTALSEFIRYRIFIKMWEGIGCPEFDIARSTMNLIYNQTLFYIGLYFSPVLSLIITVKMFLTFYIKKWGAIYNCKPFLKPWRASQAHTVYLSIAFFSFFSVFIAYGYIITSVRTSNCGPFGGGKFIYMSILNEISENNDSIALTILFYATRPGVVGIGLMALVLGVYYMRAVALARIHVVNHLRHLLILKAEDRKLLLGEIAKYTNVQPSNANWKPSFSGEGFADSRKLKNDDLNLGMLKDNCWVQNENFGKFSDFEGKTKENASLLSLANLPAETEKNLTNRNRIFRSLQNLNGTIGEGSSGLNFPAKKDNLKNSEMLQTMIELHPIRNPDSKKQSVDFFAENYREKKSPLSLPKVEKQDLDSAEDSGEEEKIKMGGKCRLNFNPVFTESFPIEANDEKSLQNFVEVNQVENDRLPGPSHENPIEGNRYVRTELKNYRRFQERIPSRIGFDSHSDNKILKKKKRV